MGRRRYKTTDDSRNSFILAMICLGEGWHNNHHRYQSSTNQGFFWWEIDVTYYLLKGLEALGVVSGIRKAPVEKLPAAPATGSAGEFTEPVRTGP